GVGLEMEADKPGWCDALNGLPGLFGSSSHEMFELQRLVRFLSSEALPVAPHKTLEIPTEIASFLKDVETALTDWGGKDFRLAWVGPFREGAVHALKHASPPEARRLYTAVKRSELVDKKLGMYKLNVSLENESTEIGRIRVFSAGWLENESVFLHMHYKYLLE